MISEFRIVWPASSLPIAKPGGGGDLKKGER